MADTKNGISFQGDGNIFAKFLNPNLWKGNLESEIRKATIRNSLFLIKTIKDNIRSDKFKENAPMTLALKRSTKTLIDQRNLWGAIDHALKSSFESEVGIIQEKASTGSKFGKTKSQLKIKHLVELMESGYTIKVTEKMKKAIAATLSADKTKTGKVTARSRVALDRLSQINGVKNFVVPPRPIFSSVWEDPSIEKVLQANWRKALEVTFKKQGAKGGEEKDK